MINRTTAPTIQTIDHIDLQEPAIQELKNGAPVYHIGEVDDETVRLDFVFNSGSLSNSRVISKVASSLLLSGTENKTSSEIEEAVDQLGGFTIIDDSLEKNCVTIIGLREHIIAIAEIVIDAIKNVNFDEREINQFLQSHKKKMAISLEKGTTQARRAFLSNLFEDNPYGELTELKDYDRVEQKELIEFHNTNYLSGLHYISIVGNLSEDEINTVGRLGEQFKVNNHLPEELTYKNAPKRIHIEKEKAVQTAIRVGRLMFNKTHKDFIDFSILNTVLGGFFGSRLMTSIREDKGYTYGIGSGVAQLNETGYFFISTEVGKEFKDLTLEAIQVEIKKLQDEEIDEEELSLVKNYMIGSILESSDGPQAMMDRFLSVQKFGMEISYYDTILERINGITANEIKQLANRYLNWEDFLVVTAG